MRGLTIDAEIRGFLNTNPTEFNLGNIEIYRVTQKTVNPFKKLYFMNQSTYLQK